MYIFAVGFVGEHTNETLAEPAPGGAAPARSY